MSFRGNSDKSLDKSLVNSTNELTDENALDGDDPFNVVLFNTRIRKRSDRPPSRSPEGRPISSKKTSS